MTRDMELGEAGFRVVAHAGPSSEELTQAFSASDRLLLFMGTGGGTVGPGRPLPEAEKWSVYVKADSAEEAKQLVEEALGRLDRFTMVHSVEPFRPDLSS